MTPPGSTAGLTVLAALVALLPVALGFGLARMAGRRTREDGRQHARRLAETMIAYLGGRMPATALGAAARGADEATFWTAFEARLPALPRADRRRLARALARNRHPAAERRALLYESPLRRELAARRLGLLPSAMSRRALRAAMAADRGAVAFAAARALARLGDLPALDWLLEHPGHLRRRSRAEWAALFRAFGRRALARITEAIEAGVDDPRVLCGAIEAVGLGRHAAASPVLERLLGHAEVDVRVTAARGIGRLAAEPCSDALVHALRDPAWPVRAQAAWALGRLGRDTAAGVLGLCLTDREWWVRHHAAYALSRLGDRGVRTLSDAATGSPDRYASDIAQEALTALRHSA